MDTYQVSLGGALLVIAFTLVYVILFFMILFKIFGQRGKKTEQFCAQAERNGRMVTAYREDYLSIPFNEDGRKNTAQRGRKRLRMLRRFAIEMNDMQKPLLSRREWHIRLHSYSGLVLPQPELKRVTSLLAWG